MPAQLVRTVNTNVSIAGTTFPCKSWKATLANQGSMATAEATGALSDLIDSGLDIIALSQDPNGAEFDIRAGYNGDNKLIFSGVVDSCDLDWDEDTFEIKGRDHSASFADGKQTVAKLNYRNQTVADMVRQIAQLFGFATQITDPGVMAGPLMNGEYFFNPQPQNYWSLLQTLAESVGYECYMTPQQVLYFGPEKDQGAITVNYGAPRGQGTENPGWGLTVSYNPRNNSNITVKALSVNPQSTQSVTASATATPVKTGRGRRTRSSLTGTGKTRYPGSGGGGNNSPAKSVYYIRYPGATPDQAQHRCQAMADNLALHQIILGLTIEGNLDMVLHSQVTLVETTIDLYGFDGIPLNVSEVTHEYETPGDGASTGGFTTTFRALAQAEN